MEHAATSDEPSRPPPEKRRYQISIAWLMILTACFGVLFAIYRAILPIWPSKSPMLGLFLLWTAAIVGQYCFLIWGACVREKEQEGHRFRVLYDVLWSLPPTGLWLAVIVSLVKGSRAILLNGEIGVLFAAVVIHFAPAAIIPIMLGVKAWRRAEPLPSRMTYWSLAASYVMPAVAVVVYVLMESLG